jgi:hypothetical protein
VVSLFLSILLPALCRTALAQPAPAPPGPAPVLTNAKAVADLRAAGIMPPQVAQTASSSTIRAGDFALLLLRTVGVDARKTLNVVAATAESQTLATQAVTKLNFAPNAATFANPAAPITREDAVSTAISAAASKGLLRAGAVPVSYPPFVDDGAFSSPQRRELAHLAVFHGLMRVGPDAVFGPKRPLTYGDAAYLLDAIRITGHGPEVE